MQDILPTFAGRLHTRAELRDRHRIVAFLEHREAASGAELPRMQRDRKRGRTSGMSIT